VEIGNEADARLIRDWVRAWYGEEKYPRTTQHMRSDPPEGWTYLGEGSFRSVWLSPDGVAYKVQHRPDSVQSNEGEYQALERARDREAPVGSRLPACSFYPLGFSGNGVLAMERIVGKTVYALYSWDQPKEITDLMWQIECAYNLCDMHSENVMIEESTKVLIPVDFGR